MGASGLLHNVTSRSCNSLKYRHNFSVMYLFIVSSLKFYLQTFVSIRKYWFVSNNEIVSSISCKYYKTWYLSFPFNFIVDSRGFNKKPCNALYSGLNTCSLELITQRKFPYSCTKQILSTRLTRSLCLCSIFRFYCRF